jgi:hypothetical protein
MTFNVHMLTVLELTCKIHYTLKNSMFYMTNNRGMNKFIDHNEIAEEVAGAAKKITSHGKLYVASLNLEMIMSSAEEEYFSSEFEENPSGYMAYTLPGAEDSFDNNRVPAILTAEDERRLYDEYY